MPYMYEIIIRKKVFILQFNTQLTQYWLVILQFARWFPAFTIFLTFCLSIVFFLKPEMIQQFILCGLSRYIFTLIALLIMSSRIINLKQLNLMKIFKNSLYVLYVYTIIAISMFNILIIVDSHLIYSDPPDFFYSQLCTLGTININSSVNFNVTTIKPQLNIQKSALTLAQFSKTPPQQIDFKAFLQNMSTSNFVIQVSTGTNYQVSKIGFFMIFIKQQPAAYLDLIQVDISIGSDIDNFSGNRQHQTDIPVSSTIFNSFSGVLYISCISYLSIDQSQTGIAITLSANVSGSVLSSYVTLYPSTRIYFCTYIVFLYAKTILDNNTLIAYLRTDQDLEVNNTYSFSPFFSYGPPYDQKCFYGSHYIGHYSNTTLNVETYKLNQSYISISQTSSTGLTNLFSNFCIASTLQVLCSLSIQFYDKYLNNCYGPLNCTVKIVSSQYLSNDTCILCVSYACQQCDQNNRKNCTQCKSDSNSILNVSTGNCDCIENYQSTNFTVYYSSISQSILWMQRCTLNCTHFIQGCLSNSCSNQTFCTQCISALVVKQINSTHQICACPASGQYYNSSKDQCKMCEQTLNFCTQCSNSSICNTCKYPHLISDGSACTKCENGFQYSDGYCTKQGCKIFIFRPNGSFQCLMCLTEQNYALNQINGKCVCNLGYSQTILPSSLKVCRAVCGDKLIVNLTEECDDGNTFSNDGCSSTCLLEDNFHCFGQPSQCILFINFASLQYKYVERALRENKAFFYFILSPKVVSLQLLNWSNFLRLNFTNSSVLAQPKYNYDAKSGTIKMEVSFVQDLENSTVEATLTFDPSMIVSIPDSLSTKFQIKGINAAIIYEDQTVLDAYSTIDFSLIVLSAVLGLGFAIESFFHKMIGLETIQIVQMLYFSRVIIDSQNHLILNYMNSMKYSSGYSNSEWFFGQNKISQNIKTFSTVSSSFLKIELEKYFLMNTNVQLIPIVIAVAAYLICLIKKFKAKNDFIESKGKVKQFTNEYTKYSRASQWIYDHFIFPLVILLTFITCFSTVLQLQSQGIAYFGDLEDSLKSLTSYSLLSCILFLIFFIYSMQLLKSYASHMKLTATNEEKQLNTMSAINRLEYDENNLDKINFHQFYPFIYLLYYLFSIVFIQFGVLSSGFQNQLEIVIALSCAYLILISWWRPYHESVNFHNYFLIFNQGVITLFLVTCELFTRTDKINARIQISCIMVLIGLVCFVVIGGFIRVVIEKRYRKRLQQNRIEAVDANGNLNKQQEKKESKKNLLSENKFAFENQLKKIANQKYGMQRYGANQQLTYNDQDQIIKQIRQQIRKQNLTPPFAGYPADILCFIRQESEYNKNNQMHRKRSQNLEATVPYQK